MWFPIWGVPGIAGNAFSLTEATPGFTSMSVSSNGARLQNGAMVLAHGGSLGLETYAKTNMTFENVWSTLGIPTAREKRAIGHTYIAQGQYRLKELLPVVLAQNIFGVSFSIP